MLAAVCNFVLTASTDFNYMHARISSDYPSSLMVNCTKLHVVQENRYIRLRKVGIRLKR
jgi:hypothetical protein